MPQLNINMGDFRLIKALTWLKCIDSGLLPRSSIFAASQVAKERSYSFTPRARSSVFPVSAVKLLSLIIFVLILSISEGKRMKPGNLQKIKCPLGCRGALDGNIMPHFFVLFKCLVLELSICVHGRLLHLESLIN